MANKLFIILGLAIVGALAAFMFVHSHDADSTELNHFRRFNSHLEFDELEYRMSLFREWRAKYNKYYNGLEGPLRFKVWSDNYDMVQEHNAKDLGWELEMNAFADLTNEEFVALYTGFRPELALNEEGNVEFHNEFELPEVTEDLNDNAMTVNWTAKGAVTSVENQGSCGACWSFSAAAALEGVYKIRKGSLIRLSKQQQVDCSTSYGNQGCNGGLMNNAFRYTQAKGIERESDYPYQTRQSTCRYSSSKVVFKNTGYKQVSVSYTALQSAVKLQPVSVGVQAAGTMQMYKGGILKSNCGTALDHAITIAGYGSENGVNFWWVKNSWGTSWGERGYIRIQIGSQNSGKGLCGINSAASYPTL